MVSIYSDLFFGSFNDINSLVCQYFDGSFYSKREKQGAQIDFIFSEKINEDEFEIMFFVENRGCEILVNNKKATFFDLSDTITLKKDKVSVSLKFDPLLDDKFCGHIFRGNRPSQLSFRKDKLIAYDYVIALRTIARREKSKIGAKIQVYTG